MRCSSVVWIKSPLLLALVALTCAQQFPQQVAILRQINHVNDDGSYTYGYEAADGSFKIETRDVTGTVRGMFGFLDESGRQRRVSYTAGNTTGFQTTGEPPGEVTTQPPRSAPEHPVLRPVRPLPTAPSGHKDSVAKLIRHLGIIGAKQAGSHRFLYASEGSSTTTVSPMTTTTTTAGSKREEDQPTTRRPTVVQRIVRTRPRTGSRKFHNNPSNSQTQGETSTVTSTTEKQGEVDEKDDGTPSPLDTQQKRPMVALKGAENPGSPRFVILPSRLLRWRPEEHDEKTNVEQEGIRQEPFIRQRLVNFPIQKDSLRYRLRPVPREQLAAPQTPLHIFAQKSELPPNYQNQQFFPQKNVYTFLSSTPRPRPAHSQPLPVSPPVHSGNTPEMYHQAYDLSESPNGISGVIINDGNYTPKTQHIPHYLNQNHMFYQPRPLAYNAYPNRYGSYYNKPDAYPSSVQHYPVYGQRGLIELLLAYLQHQTKSSPHQGEYTNQLPYDLRAILPRPHYAQDNSGFQPSPILIPYPAPPEQFHIPINNVAPIPRNYELARVFDQRLILSPAIIRQPIDAQNRIQRPPIYGSGLNFPYVKNKENAFPVNLYVDPRNVHFRQGEALRPAPLPLQPIYVGTARSHSTPHPLDYSISPARQGPAVSVTTVSPRSAIQTPLNSENQGLPFGFTKKFRSVEVITPETDTPAQKNSKND